MIDFTVRSLVNTGKLKQKARRGRQISQFAVDTQVLKTSNKYAPKRDNFLIESGARHSQIGKGLIKWQTPYSRRLYYNPQYNFSKDKNPQAGGLWFERAKAQHKNEWLKAAKDGYRQTFGR